jgi:hypothetical protein
MALHLTSTDNLNIVVIEFGGDVWRFRPPQVATKEWNYKVAGKLGTRTAQSIYVRNDVETTTVTVVQSHRIVDALRLRTMGWGPDSASDPCQPSPCINANAIMEADGIILSLGHRSPSRVLPLCDFLPGLLAGGTRCRWILFTGAPTEQAEITSAASRLRSHVGTALGRTVYIGQTAETREALVTALVSDRSTVPSKSLPEWSEGTAVPMLTAQQLPALTSSIATAFSVAPSTPRQPALIRIDPLFLGKENSAFGIVTVLRGRLQGNTMFRCQAFPDSDVLMVETLTSLQGDVKIGTATAGAVVRVTARFCLCEPRGDVVRMMDQSSGQPCSIVVGYRSYNRQMCEGTTWFEAPNPLDAAELPLPTVSAILKLRNPTHEFLTELRRDPNKPFEAAIALTGSAAATLQMRLLEGSEDEVWVVDLGNCAKPRYWGASLNIYPGGRQGGIGSRVVLMLTDERRDRVMSCAAEVVERWDFVAGAIARVATSPRLSGAPVPPPLPVGVVTSEQILLALSGNGGHGKASSRLVRLLCDFTFAAAGTAKERSAGGTATKDITDVPFRPLLAALLSKDLLLEVDRLVLNFDHTLHARVQPLAAALSRGVRTRSAPRVDGWRLRPTLLEELLMPPCDGDSALKAAACAPAVLAVLVVGHIWNPVNNPAVVGCDQSHRVPNSCRNADLSGCFERYLCGDQYKQYWDLLLAFRLVSLQQRFLPPRPRSRPFQPMAARHPSALRRLYPHIELAASMMSSEYAAHVATALSGIARGDWCRPHRQNDTTAVGCQAAQLTDPRSPGAKPRCRVMDTDADLKRKLYGAAASPRDAPPGVCAELLYRFWHLYEHHLHLHASGEATAGSLPPVRCIAETLGHSVAALQLRLLAVPLYRIMFGSKHDGNGAATSSPPFPQVRGSDGEVPAASQVHGGGALVDHGGSKTAVIARMFPRTQLRESAKGGLPRWLVLFAACIGDPRTAVGYGTAGDASKVTLQPKTQLAVADPRLRNPVWTRELPRVARVLLPAAARVDAPLANVVFSLRCIAFQQVLGGIGRRDAQRGSPGLPESVVKLIFLFWHGDWRAYLAGS